ncbi:MAG: cob(I)yrinic acid a,c-diamide adenosyltransferase [Candidatus Micrarchaeota archaeon]|nr:cob(I)yrinic acid a,c-diamide adenosyltransferase [Candidatus Micrarchaeota archaeon]
MPAKSYTGKGDSGQSGLGSGKRHPKSHPTFEAVGTLDELMAAIGMAEAGLGYRDEQLETIQRDLFEAGALFGHGWKGKRGEDEAASFAGKLKRLEGWIDAMDARLPALRHFILPGGCALSSRLHYARTVCRRAERRAEASKVPGRKEVLPYLNRLSSYFFTRARMENRKANVADIVWPGKGES